MGGQTTGNIEDLQLTQSERPDPRTQARQEHLFRQAEQYAGQSPFQQQYGYGSSMVPGLSGMSQTGQQYLTDRILGKGAYRVQNLGFQNYVRPDTALAGGYQYGQSGYQAGDEFTPGRRTSDRQQRYVDAPDTYFIDNPDAVQPDEWGTWTDAQRREWISNQGTPLGMSTAPGSTSSTLPAAKMQTTGYAAVNQPGYSPATQQASTGGVGLGPQPGPKPGQPGYVRPGRERSDWSPWMGETYEEGAPSGMAGVNQPGYELNIWDTPDIPFGAQNLPTATSGDIYRGREGTGGGLLQTDLNRPTSGVGIGEVEDARTATRRMLMEGPRAGDPGYNQFLPGGWTGLDKAGTGTAAGDPSIARLGEEAVPDPTLIGTDFGVAAPTDITGIPDIEAQDIADFGEGYAGDAVTAGALANTEPNVRVDPITGAVTQDVLGVAPTPIAAPGEVTIDPVTGETTQAVAGVTPSTFGGASFLGGNLDPYMNQLGVDAQVAAAQQDYLKAQNQEQARRAQSHAWGTRGDIPRAEQETAMLARIAEIRRKGYTDAADRMEADLQRQQAAGMQTQQLGIQGGLQGQQLEAQRRESDAARAQQAALSGQQLGTQAALQTQQLGQAGGIRAAELDAQIGLAGQQLQAQRREADAARSQQAAIQAQQLDTEARLQEQRIGTERTQRKTELDLQAALANQQAALQSGNQTQQLEAQRAIRQAELDLEQQRATTGVGADVAMQQQQLQQQAGMQTAQNQLEAARADQQAAFQSGNAQAQYEAQRQMREAELRLQRGMQTQQLGADAARQQTQNEFARRQALAEMGLQAQGMGMDDQARFREQQMALAQQLGRQGLDEQAATFAAAQQLAQMGGTQEQRQQMQAAADYEQWLRSQEGFADEAAFLQAMQPQAGMAQYQRKPSTWGQVAGGLLSAGGAAATAFGSDARIKDNIEYVGMENGFKTYEFNYLGRDNRYKGVMAQEVILERPDAVEMQDGFYRVNYDAIGVQFEAV